MQKVRFFLQAQHYLELDVPQLTAYPAAEAYIDSLAVSGKDSVKKHYLYSSPEYNLKKIAALSQTGHPEFCRIFNLGHCFRADGQSGRLHSREFLMLELYNLEADLITLASLVQKLLHFVAPDPKQVALIWPVVSMKQIVTDLLHAARIKPAAGQTVFAQLDAEVQNINPESTTWSESDRFSWYYLHKIEARLPPTGFYWLCDFPAHLAAQSQISGSTCRRIELYYGSIELGNGYLEDFNAASMERFYQQENEKRQFEEKPIVPVDREFIQAVSQLELYKNQQRLGNVGSGIAIGLDRLFMVLTGLESLSNSSPFQ